MPLVSATPGAGSNAGVRVRVRARLAATLRNVKIPAWVGVVGGDVRRWWLVAEQPPSLQTWLASQSPALEKVPDRNAAIRAAWTAHNWTFGVFALAVSVVLLLAGGLFRWLAGHPARFWTATVIAAATGTWLALA